VLLVIFLVGGLLTGAVIPLLKLVASAGFFGQFPVMYEFFFKISYIFLLPALVLSMVSPMVIKLTLADVEKTGGVVGSIYAFSTAGSIFGTFLTGFYLILWFGTALIIWIISGGLILIGLLAWFLWRNVGEEPAQGRTLHVAVAVGAAVVIYLAMFLMRNHWENKVMVESNYYALSVFDEEDGTKALVLDNLVHGYTDIANPTYLRYEYLQMFAGMTRYLMQDRPDFRVLHMGGGSYTFPRYLETVYPQSKNEVVEIDPAVTKFASTHLGLPQDTAVVTHNADARLFLARRDATQKLDIIVGDVFNDRSTPYHLLTLEFDRLVKKNLKPDGAYMINVIDVYPEGRYMPSVVLTLKQVFKNVYLFSPRTSWNEPQTSTFVIVATDRDIDMDTYRLSFPIMAEDNVRAGILFDAGRMDEFLKESKAILLTDDHVPTDIFISHELWW
jgi:spermidine synthase